MEVAQETATNGRESTKDLRKDELQSLSNRGFGGFTKECLCDVYIKQTGFSNFSLEPTITPTSVNSFTSETVSTLSFFKSIVSDRVANGRRLERDHLLTTKESSEEKKEQLTKGVEKRREEKRSGRRSSNRLFW